MARPPPRPRGWRRPPVELEAGRCAAGRMPAATRTASANASGALSPTASRTKPTSASSCAGERASSSDAATTRAIPAAARPQHHCSARDEYRPRGAGRERTRAREAARGVGERGRVGSMSCALSAHFFCYRFCQSLLSATELYDPNTRLLHLQHHLGGKERGRRWFTRIEEDELRQRRRRDQADGAAAPKPGIDARRWPHHPILR